MSFLTIFSAPKPFTNPHIAAIQRNAIQSWSHLGDEVEIFLMGDEAGMVEVASELGIRQFRDVRCNELGTPMVSSMFDLARRNSQSPILVCVNADVMFLPDLVHASHQVLEQAQKFLMIGRRWDLDVRQISTDSRFDFKDGWERQLRAEVEQIGRLHIPAGSDYFVFPRALYTEMPDFAIGRAGWDNWMIYHARQQGWAVVDATPSIMVIHQDHDYGHLPGGRPHYELPESSKNQALGGGSAHMYMILDSTRELRDGRLRSPRPSLARLLRQAEVWLTPKDSSRKGARWRIARRLRRMRHRVSGST
jgi:hypothetical protein